VLGQVLSALGAFLGIRLLTEFVSPALFGQYKLLLAMLSLATGVFVRPILQYCMRAFHDSPEAVDGISFETSTRAFFLRYALTVSACLLILHLLPIESRLTGRFTVLLLVGIFLFQSILEYEKSIAVTRNAQLLASLIGVACSWLVPIGIVGLVLAFEGITILLLAHVLVLLLIYLFVRLYQLRLTYSLRRELPMVSAPAQHLSPAISFGWPMAFVGLLGWVVHESDRFFLNFYQNDLVVGVYAAAYGLMASPFMLLVGMSAQYLYPIVFRNWASGRLKDQQRLLTAMLVSSTAAAIIGVVAVWLFSSQIAHLALGSSFREGASPLFIWLAVAYGLQGIAMSFDMAAYGSKRTVHIMLAYLVTALLNIALNIWLIPIYSAKGAAIATMLSMFAYLIVMVSLYMKSNGTNTMNEILET
jgi:O-antigen/teichoic acid export membrane protein